VLEDDVTVEKCKLIVHADDFGLSEKVNQGIAKAHCNGIVTSTSLMATGTAFESAIELSRSTPTLDIGIHLTLTEEEPVSKRDNIPTLLDNDQYFHDHAITFIKRYMVRKISLDEVKQELDDQICKILDYGVRVSHLDSHQHIHMLPGIRKVVGDLAKKYSISAIRYPKESMVPYMLKDEGNLNRLAQLLSLNMFCTIARTSGTQQPDRFFGFFYGGGLTKARLWRILQQLGPDSTSEIMCHPGVYDDACKYKHWDYHWQDELDALTDQNIKDYLDSSGIKLISYADI
jgi:hopanoid biosynthesis associated protein HpnK